MRAVPFLLIFITGLFTPGMMRSAIAQVTSDSTTNTIVNSNGNNFTIINGIEKGNNLFHSFSNFSVATAGSATFDLVNTPNINTIFSRVTGGSVSNIDGLIRTRNSSNPVNLFLMNPNGIIFGPNAKLDIGGSFVSTTANRIKFADGSEFMATNPNATPLLTIAVPIGLQFGQNPGTITDQASTTGLTLKTGKTIGLLGGEVTIDRGKITAPTGQVEVAALASNTTVNLAQTTSGWQFSYPNSEFGNVRITNAAQINADGVGGGRIQINGQQVTIDGLSSITANTSKASNGQGILIQGSDSIAIAGSNPTSGIVTNIGTDIKAGATGNGGEIRLITPTLKIQDGARIRTRVLGAGQGGSVIAQADRVELLQDTTDGKNNRFPSTLAANTEEGSQGHGGNVEITAKTVLIQDGAELRASARGSGDGGNIIVKASDLLSVTGESSTGDPGYLTGMSTSIRENATGQGGSIFLEAGKVEVLNGPAIRTGTYGQGNAGNIYVKANEATIAGYANSGIVSRFFASAYVLEENGTPRLNRSTGKGGNITFDVGYLKLFEGGKISSSSETQGNAGGILINADTVELAGKSRSPVQLSFAYAVDAGGKSGLYAFSDNTSTKDLPVSQGLRYGDAGSIRVNTNSLTVRDEAEIVVSSNNNSNAGNLMVQSDTIRLSQGGKLRAEVAYGSQGNINLASSLLLMRDGSQISSNAGSTASGGNISINSQLIFQANNSDITANAIKGQGGNINLTTKSLIGGAFRPQLTPDSDITASSEFGINGSVQISTPDVNPNSGLVELPVNLVDSSQQIATGCSHNTGSSFVATGRGGIPQNPNQQVRSDVYDGLRLRTWSDIRDLSAFEKTGTITAQIPQSPKAIIQATSWHRNPQGQIELVADKSPAQVQPTLTCAAVTKS
ncbi:S-layer family protein [Nostoc sp. ChiQUE01b]|uniref:S-layer family protein n=1 Tax=Nostoc sp. ChiQUE01b TaxID=3075376 RepID=UPI002AD2EA12|nr:S-layer family protein [Nostoc sp. ChiQUE01b]MDZ8260532.1 S-layer family protein [Nostoc sp. ChiQUE01b]